MQTIMNTPKQFAKSRNYFVIVRDAAGEIFDDHLIDRDGKRRAVPFAFKTERTAIRHASRRALWYVRPNGQVVNTVPACEHWGYCSIHGSYTPSVGCAKCARS